MEIRTYEKLPKEAEMIRKKVFMEEQGFENEFDEIDNISLHIVIFESSNPVGTCRFYYSDVRQCYVIGRITVMKEFRGRNYGTKLIKIAEEEIKKIEGKVIELSAQVRVTSFYEKNGYITLDEVYIDEGCPHVWMRKELY